MLWPSAPSVSSAVCFQPVLVSLYVNTRLEAVAPTTTVLPETATAEPKTPAPYWSFSSAIGAVVR